jgi:hypothetical protein
MPQVEIPSVKIVAMHDGRAERHKLQKVPRARVVEVFAPTHQGVFREGVCKQTGNSRYEPMSTTNGPLLKMQPASLPRAPGVPVRNQENIRVLPALLTHRHVRAEAIRAVMLEEIHRHTLSPTTNV